MTHEPGLQQFRQEALNDELGGRQTLLTIGDVAEFQAELIGDHTKLFFGMPISQAVEEGYAVSRRSFFETSHSPITQITARTTSDLLASISFQGERKVLDLFAGTGHNAWAFSKEGFRVDCIEQNAFTAECTRVNLALAEAQELTNVLNTDALSFLQTLPKNNQYAAAFLDPPWNNAYNHRVDRVFSLRSTQPRLDEVTTALARCKRPFPLIVFKVPQNVDMDEVYAHCENLGYGAFIQHQVVGSYQEDRPTGVINVYMSQQLRGLQAERVFIEA